MRNGNGEQPISWVIRFTSRADDDLMGASAYFAEQAGISIARAWVAGLRAEAAKLALLPTRWPVAEESSLFRENVRRMLYRRTRGGPSYRVLYILRQSLDDAPTVAIIHVRHAAQAPMTQDEAREIESAE